MPNSPWTLDAGKLLGPREVWSSGRGCSEVWRGWALWRDLGAAPWPASLGGAMLDTRCAWHPRLVALLNSLAMRFGGRRVVEHLADEASEQGNLPGQYLRST